MRKTKKSGLTRKQKDLARRQVIKANKRLKEMRKHYKQGNRALDFADLSIKKTGGKSEFKLKKGASKSDYNKIVRATQKLINSPYSTEQGRKKLTEKTFRTYAENRGLDYDELRESFEKMENILSSNVFSKLMEQYEHDSDSVMETILNMAETEMKSSDIIKLMNDFNKTNKDVSLRNYVDEFLENEGKRFTRD